MYQSACDHNVLLEINLSSLNATVGFIMINGGSSVNSAGDVNNDGLNDVIVGRQRTSFKGFGGASYVVYGRKLKS